MQVPSEVDSAVVHVTPLVAKYRQFVEAGLGAELEVRLGRRVEGVWDPNITAPAFHAALELLQEYDGWERVVHAQDAHDYFYVLADGRKIRTSITFGAHVSVTHAHKVAVMAQDVKLVGQPFDARASLKTETMVRPDELPPMVEPHLVRIKKRWSFWLSKWRFDMTQVWSGITRSVAEANQSRNFSTYEVEVECVCSPHVVTTLSDEYLALSMLLKLSSLLASPHQRMVPLL